MRLHEIVETSRRVSETSGRSDKVRHLTACLQSAEPDAIETAVALLLGRPRQGRIGIGWATMEAAVPQTAARTPALMLLEVDAALERIARTSGAGSPGSVTPDGRAVARATRDEQDFLLRAVLGEFGRARSRVDGRGRSAAAGFQSPKSGGRSWCRAISPPSRGWR